MAFPQQKRRSRRRLPALLATVALAAAGVAALRVGPAPQLVVDPQLPAIGPATVVHLEAHEPRRGLGTVRVELIQGETSQALVEESHQPLPAWALWGERTPSTRLEVSLGSRHQEWLREGSATLRLTVERAGSWLRNPPPAQAEIELPVQLTPPRIEVLSRPARVRRGGAAVVVYRAAGAAEDGVRLGDHWFPGSAHPNEPGARLAFFAIPHDAATGQNPRVVARDTLGNEAEQPFVEQVRERTFTTDTIRLSDGFMERVVPAIVAQTPDLEAGDELLATYLTINRDLRRANAEALTALAAESRQELLWSGVFDQLPSSRSMAPFADRRTYVYNGKPVDEQVHLGYDLASVRRASVPSANAGVVAMATYFGIYGNTVVVDHGFGLMSLYSHLSEISVQTGDTVTRGQTLGRTGQTGLAGGDHLHFSMLVHGTQVDPLEWWDGRWIERQILAPLGLAEASE